MTTVIVSGGFDPIHKGHIRYLKAARELGDKLIVILNCDDFLIRKKGYYCFDAEERAEILEAVKYVDGIIEWQSEADDVCDVLEYISKTNNEMEKPRKLIFAKGGDRRPDGVPIPEVEVCERCGIEIVYGVGGNDKPNSSSWIIDNIVKQLKKKTKKELEKELHDERLQNKLELEVAE